MRGRDSKGRFLKKSGSRSRRAHKGRSRHHVRGYTERRRGKTVRVAPHTSYEPMPRRRRRRARRSRSRAMASPARRSSGRRGRGGSRPVIVVANEPRSYGRRRRARQPPMFTAAGMAVFGVSMIVGYEIANYSGRFYEGMNPTASTTGTTGTSTLPSGITSVSQYNELVQAAPPSLAKTGIELGISLVGFLLGWVAKSPLLKLAGYGWGFGALAHIVGQLIDTYLVLPMLVTTSGTTTGGTTGTSTLGTYGQILLQHEYTAQQAKAAAAAVSGSASLGAPPTGTGLPLNRAGTAVRQLQPAPRLPPVMLAPTGAKPQAGWHQQGAPTTGTVPPTVAPQPLSPQNPVDVLPPGSLGTAPPASPLGTQPTTPVTTTPAPVPPMQQSPGQTLTMGPNPPKQQQLPPGMLQTAPAPTSAGCASSSSTPGGAVGSPPDDAAPVRMGVPMRDGSSGRSIQSVPMRTSAPRGVSARREPTHTHRFSTDTKE